MRSVVPLLRGVVATWRPADSDEIDVVLRDRMRLVASCLALVAIALLTSPGRIIADTKLDMPLDPVAFLARALHLWDPAQFGQIQNQAYGYLFPMGPFYALGVSVLHISPWVVQRMWMSLVLCAAFLGVVKLARALRIGTPLTGLIAGFGYALAPHAQALIGVNSSELWPTAVVPWIVLPLVRGAEDRGSSPRRAAALSAVGVFCCGGINAAAEAAVLAIPLVYLLSRQRGPRRARLLGWWLVFTACATFWWLVPLAVMGSYVYSFMPFTESSAATTGVTSLTNILRGMEDWTAFVPVDGRPWWPAGFQQATAGWLIALTAIVAAFGLIGLLWRGLRERTFLLVLLLLGIAIMTSGHVSDVSGPAAPFVRHLFNGTLAPLRNIHKFDAMVRLPICLGLAHMLTVSLPRARLRLALFGGVAAALALTMIPVATPGLAASGSFPHVPGYWRQAAHYLNRHTSDQQSVLALPGSRWGEYTWGRPLDEPMQALLKVRWASQQIVPSGSNGLADTYEAIDDRMTSGRGSPGLSDLLRRMGVKYVLVRNDLDRTTLRGAWPARIHQALSASPGLKRVKYFGGLTGSQDTGNATTWFDQPYPALEVYRVRDPAPVVGTVSDAKPLRVTGGPQALLGLADQGLLRGDRPVLLDNDPGADKVPLADTVVTDTLRRREVDFSDMRQNVSPTMTRHQRYKGSGPAHDYDGPQWAPYRSYARYSGVKSVTASSSASDVTAPSGSRQQGDLPYAAFDEDMRTAWTSAGWAGATGEWLETRFAAPLPLKQISVAFEHNSAALGPPVSEVAVQTQHGTVRQGVRDTGDEQLLKTPKGTTTWLKIKVLKLAWKPHNRLGSKVGITDVGVPGLISARSIVTPELSRPGPSTPGHRDPSVLLTAGQKTTPGCMRGSHEWVCSGELATQGEDGYGFDRTFDEPHRAHMEVGGSTELTDPGLIQQLTTFSGQYPKVTASSTLMNEPQLLGRSALDGDPSTTWIPSADDQHPALRLNLGHPHALSRIRVDTPTTNTIGTPPIHVTITAGGQVRTGWVNSDGWIAFPKLRAERVTIRFTPLPSSGLQVSDLTIPGVHPLGAPSNLPIRTKCGFGPALDIDGYPISTKITGGTIADALTGRPLRFRTCRHVVVHRGDNRMYSTATSPYRLLSAAVRPRHSASVPAADARMDLMPIQHWGAGTRTVHVATNGPSYLVVNENYNAGWHATINGKRLKPVRLDGWRQGFVIPRKTYASVTLRYGPDRPYRLALAVGLLLVLVVLGAATAPARRAIGVLGTLGAGRLARPSIWVGGGLLGLWVAGVPGAVFTLVTMLLISRARKLLASGGLLDPAVRLASRVLASPWLAGTFMTGAGICLALGAWLQSDEQFGFSGPLRDVAAQLLCLPLLGVLCVGLLYDHQTCDEGQDRTEDTGRAAGAASPIGARTRRTDDVDDEAVACGRSATVWTPVRAATTLVEEQRPASATERGDDPDDGGQDGLSRAARVLGVDDADLAAVDVIDGTGRGAAEEGGEPGSRR